MKINGSLIFDASSASEIQNLRVQKVSSLPTHLGAADNGRMVYDTTATILYYGSLTAWVPIATGGNAAALQGEVDAIETSLGAIVNSLGVFQVGAVTGPTGVASATNLTKMLQAIANYATGKDQLSELLDVSFTGLSSGQYLKYNGTVWANDTLQLNDLTDITATAAQVNVLATIPAGLTGTELGYVDGVTSPIQSQLDNKQPLDAGLTSLSALAATGIIVQTAQDVFAARSLVAPAAGITITDPAGIAGNPTFALANDLAALEGLATTGYIVRTGNGTATTRLFTGASGQIVITNGDGVASNTDVGLATVTDTGTGTFLKFTRDTFGRVSGTSAVVASDITGLVSAIYVDVAGDTMTGNLVFSGGSTVTGLPTPTGNTDAANKAYVDSLTNGLSWKPAVRVATTANITLSGTQTIDGVAVVAGDRVLVKDQTIAANNGIYVVAAGAWTRAVDMDQPLEFDGSAMFVQEGTLNEGTGWTETLTVTTVGTSAVAFSQFSGGQAFIWGTGLGNTGNTIFVNLGAGIQESPTDEIGIDLFNNTTGALVLTDNGTSRAAAPATNSKLHLLLDATATGGLDQGTLGLFIKAAGVTNAMIANPSHVLNGDTGSGSLALGQALQVIGTSVQGISTSVSGQAITITAANASTSQKGVASFASGDFDVTAGVVTVKAAGIDNVQLANSVVTFAGTGGTPDPVALGETLTFTSTVSGLVSSTVGANTIALDVRNATASLTGVASFAAADFLVTAGAVTAVAKNISSLTDVETTSPAAGQVLSWDGTNWINKKVYHVETIAAASTTWTVSHGLGVRYCNVTVVDSTDEVVIPQSITFNTTTQLTVVFNTAIAGKVVVMGIA